MGKWHDWVISGYLMLTYGRLILGYLGWMFCGCGLAFLYGVGREMW